MDPREACRLLDVTPPKMAGLPRGDQERLLQEWKDGPLKVAWKAASKEHHPDLNGGTKEATAKFAQLSAAYTTLKDLLELTPPEPEPRDVPTGERHFRWGPVEITLTAADEQLLEGLGRVLRDRIDRQATQHEKLLRRFVQDGFGDILDGLMGADLPKRRKVNKPTKPPKRKPNRTTTIG